MKKQLLGLLSMLMLLTFTSCENSEMTGPSWLVGTWNYSQSTSSPSTYQWGYYEFNDDGTGTYYREFHGVFYSEHHYEFTYSVKGDKVYCKGIYYRTEDDIIAEYDDDYQKTLERCDNNMLKDGVREYYKE